jgi:outer membrane biosynthesis protein TonB
MTRPRLFIVLLLCASAFLGTLAVATATEDDADDASPTPDAMEPGRSSEVPGLGRAAPLPALRPGRRRRAPASGASPSPAAATPSPAPAPPSPPPAASPAPSPAPAPKPKPKPAPKPDSGTPFFDAG